MRILLILLIIFFSSCDMATQCYEVVTIEDKIDNGSKSFGDIIYYYRYTMKDSTVGIFTSSAPYRIGDKVKRMCTE